jgi:hypothetical protein
MSVSAGHRLRVQQRLSGFTTYVTFAAVVAHELGRRTMSRGDADLKIGRAIWVVFSGSRRPARDGRRRRRRLDAAGSGHGGLVAGLVANLALRAYVKIRATRHERQYHTPSCRRAKPPKLPLDVRRGGFG